MRVDIKDESFKKRTITLETENDLDVMRGAIRYYLGRERTDKATNIDTWHTLDSLLGLLID